MTQRIQAWLGSFEGLGLPTVDALAPEEGWGLFPQGERILRRTTDILGNTRLRRQVSYKLKLHRKKDSRGDDPGIQPLLERLSRWVTRDAPVFGRDQTVRAENARLTAQNREDMARYEVLLVFEFEEAET